MSVVSDYPDVRGTIETKSCFPLLLWDRKENLIKNHAAISAVIDYLQTCDLISEVEYSFTFYFLADLYSNLSDLRCPYCCVQHSSQ